jgi:hypothetical protein
MVQISLRLILSRKNLDNKISRSQNELIPKTGSRPVDHNRIVPRAVGRKPGLKLVDHNRIVPRAVGRKPGLKLVDQDPSDVRSAAGYNTVFVPADRDLSNVPIMVREMRVTDTLHRACLLSQAILVECARHG